MRCMLIVKASAESEAGVMPKPELIDQMTKFTTEMQNAGVLLDYGGLQPSSKGARVKFSKGKRSVIDGPFAESKELIAGYWLLEVKSREEAIEWAKRCPEPMGDGNEAVLEIRPLFGLDDFEPSEAIDRARELNKQFQDKQS